MLSQKLAVYWHEVSAAAQILFVSIFCTTKVRDRRSRCMGNALAYWIQHTTRI